MDDQTLHRRALCLGLLALGGCSHVTPPQVQSSADPQARWVEGQAAYLAWSGRRRHWGVTPSGLQYRRLKAQPSSHPRPAPGATVTVHYTGRFIDGRVFDSSRERGEPATFPLGRVIKGWQEGVPMMRQGEVWSFVIPADIAYGERNRPPIPPGSVLLFDIELLSIVAAT